MMSKNNGLDRMMQSKQARAQNLRKWRESRLHEETLPSGLQVLLRDVDVQSIVIEGDVPNTLIDLVSSEDFQKLNEEEAGTKMLSDHKADFNTLLRQVITAALVEPSIGSTADDVHILYSELTFEDKMHIFSFMNREAQEVRPFREESKSPGEPAQSGGSVRIQAE